MIGWRLIIWRSELTVFAISCYFVLFPNHKLYFILYIPAIGTFRYHIAKLSFILGAVIYL